MPWNIFLINSGLIWKRFKVANFLGAAQDVGWHYLVGLTEAEAVAIADVRKDEIGNTAFSRLARGRIARHLWDATMLASAAYGDPAKDAPP